VFKKETIHRVSRHVIIPSTALRLVSCIKREKPMRFFFFSSTFDFARAMCDARLSRQSMIPQNLRTGTAKEIISRSKVPAKGRQREDRKRNTHTERERERERERGGGTGRRQQDVRVRPFGIVCCAPELWENLRTWKRRPATSPLSRFSVAPFYEYSSRAHRARL